MCVCTAREPVQAVVSGCVQSGSKCWLSGNKRGRERPQGPQTHARPTSATPDVNQQTGDDFVTAPTVTLQREEGTRQSNLSRSLFSHRCILSECNRSLLDFYLQPVHVLLLSLMPSNRVTVQVQTFPLPEDGSAVQLLLNGGFAYG